MKRVVEKPVAEKLALAVCGGRLMKLFKILVNNINKGIKGLFKAMKLISGSKAAEELKGFISNISKCVQCIIFIVDARR